MWKTFTDAYAQTLPGFIKLISASSQVHLQRVVVIGELVQLTPETVLFLLCLIQLLLQRVNLKVTLAHVLQQSLDLHSKHINSVFTLTVGNHPTESNFPFTYYTWSSLDYIQPWVDTSPKSRTEMGSSSPHLSLFPLPFHIIFPLPFLFFISPFLYYLALCLPSPFLLSFTFHFPSYPFWGSTPKSN